MRRSSVHRTTLEKIRAALASDVAALRAEAIDALGVLGDERGLVDALHSEDAYVRRAAVRGLQDLPGERITWRLAQTRFDPDEGVRCSVVAALARRDGWLVAHALRRIAEQDESASVRFRALVGLAETASPRVEDVLRATMEDDEAPLVREMARTLLVKRGVALDEQPGDDEEGGS